MILTDIWEKFNYRLDIPYLISMYMREYDISKANITALYSQNIINKDYYEYLYNADKQTREILIGLMQRDNPEIYKKIQNGISDAKRQLFDANSIKYENVLSIRNDSVTVINNELLNTKFGLYDFKCKGLFTTYFRLKDIDFFYHCDPILKNESVEIKGINDNVLELHLNGILDVICTTAYLLQNDSPSNAVKYISEIYDSYINRKLPINYYREFDHDSKFRFNSAFNTYALSDVDENCVDYIDINRNLQILRELTTITSSIYSNRYKPGRG